MSGREIEKDASDWRLSDSAARGRSAWAASSRGSIIDEEDATRRGSQSDTGGCQTAEVVGQVEEWQAAGQMIGTSRADQLAGHLTREVTRKSIAGRRLAKPGASHEVAYCIQVGVIFWGSKSVWLNLYSFFYLP